MEAVLWYVLTGTRGGKNRIRILRALAERRRNANQLSAGELPADAVADSLRDHIATLGGAIDSLDAAIN